MNTLLPIPQKEVKIQIATSITLFLLIIGLGGFTEYRYRQIQNANKTLVSGMATESEAREATLQAKLSALQNQSANISSSFQSQAATSAELEDKLNDISGTVGNLDKLSKVDARLLQKYSKIYFLNENYLPARLTTIDQEYTLEENRTYQFLNQAYPYLKDLFEAAKDDDIDLLAASAYRSFGTQGALKSEYKISYGSGANTFSADQGYSEHQLGTTIDFSTKAVGGTFSKFEKDPAYTWLVENGYKYGFILSYPKGNTYYVSEPWHWRFVGTDLAEDLRNDNKYFYDLDQRDIDKYLVKLFD